MPPACPSHSFSGIMRNMASTKHSLIPTYIPSRQWYNLRPVYSRLRPYATVIDEQSDSLTDKPKFPFPAHPTPTPHEIFHLTRGATQGQIKSRYYELVRYHHPDSHYRRRSPVAQAHSEFQSIIAAYDYLRGATSSPLPGATQYGYRAGNSNFDPYLHELARRRRAQRASQGAAGSGQEFYAHQEFGARDEYNQDDTRERIILVFGIISLVLGLYPSFGSLPFQPGNSNRSAALNLNKAQKDARELGDERRVEIRRRVQNMQNGNGSNDGGIEGAMNGLSKT